MKLKDDTKALDDFLKSNGINHFSAREIAPAGRERNGVKLKFPPRKLWFHIVPTLLILEELRAAFGDRPVFVHSGYRDESYNAAVGGVKFSKHVLFNAIDFSIKKISNKELANWLNNHIISNRFGIGLYKNFVHFDTRGLLGFRSARWGHPL